LKILDLDYGNTCLKWRLSYERLEWKGGVVFEDGAQESGLDKKFDMVVQAFAEIDVPKRCRMSSVRSNKTRGMLESFLYKRIKDVLIERPVKSIECGGVHLGNVDLLTCGEDCWLGFLAAKREAGDVPILVVDCGTAITLGVLSRDGIVEGMAIVPGLYPMLRLMENSTDKLKVEYDRIFRSHLGLNTQESMQYGSASMVIAFIEKLYDGLDSDAVIVMSGGDSEKLMPLLTAPVIYTPSLVLDGLDIALP